MSVLDKLLVGLIGLTALAVVLKDNGQSANNVLNGLGQFNQKTFGLFLNGGL